MFHCVRSRHCPCKVPVTLHIPCTCKLRTFTLSHVTQSMPNPTEFKAPVKKVQEFQFGDWTITTTKHHIMGSKCEHPTICDSIEDPDNPDLCLLCKFEKSLKLPSLPDMVFANNSLCLSHKNGGCIEFNTLDALKQVDKKADSVQVAHAQAWKAARSGCEYAKKIVKDYDWTFTTHYPGTLTGGIATQETTQRIDLVKLSKPEEIKFYDEVYLYEDEIDDNGCTRCVVKVRAMPSGYFIVLRHYLRVDHVLVRVNDTRLYHEAETDYILRESSSRESPISSIMVPPQVYKDPDQVWRYLAVKEETVDKLVPC